MKKILTILLAAAGLAACQSDGNDNPVPASDRITIDPIITRATEVNFEKDDQIGLTVMRGETAYTENTCLTFADGVFSGNLTWYAEAAEKSTLIAYYPYNPAGAPTKFSVAANQTTDYGTSDLMAATKADVLPSANSVSMVFKHQLTKILIDITNETGSDISSVKLQGSIPTATIDLANLSVTVDETADATDIQAQQVEANKTYRAIVVPQTVAFKLAVTTAAGKTLTQSLAEMELKSGGQYTVTARVTPEGLKVIVNGEIENWTDEGDIPAASEEVSLEEHLEQNYIVYDGETYKTVKLANNTIWMAEPLRYVPENLTPSTDPLADSHVWYPYRLIDAESTSVNADSAEALTDAESIRKYGYLYDMQAALGKEITADNCYDFEGAQGICPKGWHIPTRMEFVALCGNSVWRNGDTDPSPAQLTDATALFYNENSKGGKIALFNDGGWTFPLSGVRMSTGYTATPRYQLTIINAKNSTQTDFYGLPAMTYVMSSSCHQPTYSSSVLSNIQYFGLMTTFTLANYPEGRASVAYVSVLAGQQLRCIRDKAE